MLKILSHREMINSEQHSLSRNKVYGMTDKKQ